MFENAASVGPTRRRGSRTRRAPRPISADDRQGDEHRAVTAMTRNLYLGADLTPVIASTNRPGAVGGVAVTFERVQQSNPGRTARRCRCRDRGHATRSSGLQEAVLWRTQTPAECTQGIDLWLTDRDVIRGWSSVDVAIDDAVRVRSEWSWSIAAR